MVTTGFRECLTGKAFLRDTHKTFCFATIYTHIIHILRRVFFREKTLVITLESERLSYPQSSTQFIVVSSTPTSSYPNSWEVDSPNTYHTYPECKVRFWCCWEAFEEAIYLVDAIGLNCVIRRARKDIASSSQLVAGAWRARVHGVD